MSLTESTPHLVPVMARPGSRVSPWVSSSTCPDLYTCVPIHWIFTVPTVTVVSMRTALFSMGLEADVKHWIFPHLASLEDMIHKVDHIFVECGWVPQKRRCLFVFTCPYSSCTSPADLSHSFQTCPQLHWPSWNTVLGLHVHLWSKGKRKHIKYFCLQAQSKHQRSVNVAT